MDHSAVAVPTGDVGFMVDRSSRSARHMDGRYTSQAELDLELIQTQMAQKPALLVDAHARALRASLNVKGAEVWVETRCA